MEGLGEEPVVKRSGDQYIVERHPVDRRPADQSIDDGGRTIDIPVHEEQVSLEKRPVVYEEVNVGKREVTDTRQVSGTVRREEARVERDGEVEVDRNERL